MDEQLKKAIEVEVKHRYIDIRGKTQSFSAFMKSEAKKKYKLDKNPRWQMLVEAFERYPYAGLNDRRRTIDSLIKTLKPQNHSSDIMYVKGVGPKAACKFNKLGIYTAHDLLMYFPRKHVDYSSRTRIRDLQEGENTTVFAHIKSVSSFNSKKGLTVVKVVVADESGSLELSFFHGKSNKFLLERIKAQFPKNAAIMISGTVKTNNFTKKLTFDKPSYSIFNERAEGKSPAGASPFNASDDILHAGRIVPLYTVCEGLSVKTLRSAIFNALELYKKGIVNVVPDFIRKKYGILDKAAAVEQMHFPSSMELLEQARFSLIFEELFLVQMKLLRLRQQTQSAAALKIEAGGLVKKFIESLPFELTSAQKHAINEILNDLNSETPMGRLLQGDVGSGKTVVATVMLLAGVENGYQGALMAPTEILAQQHYNNLVQWLMPLGVNVGLFLGSHGKKARDYFQTALRSGQTHIAVGTHALIQEGIDFANLGAIVVDEQHRFGVAQRNVLKKKSQNPQMLTMTATPIPRTLALTVHGDLDLTVIDELPKGRLPIKTSLVSSHKSAYELIRREVEAGQQVYIVYPLIDESESLSAKAATIEAERLKEEVFPQYKIGLLHGKLKNDEKDAVMADFKEGKYDILVSTTVVEVGVDVPNATVMLIENAERFGLSQLHQLRGRVGRSDLQSYCILHSNTRSVETRERLNIMTQTNDGFVIAQKDLELRGPGEFLGTRQSGLPDLIISDIVRDAEILEIARVEAFDFLQTHELDDYPQLKNASSLQILTGLNI